jgi:hypothetical protein
MVDPKAPYNSLILLGREHAFHFNGQPPSDIYSQKYLNSSNYDEVVSAVLAHAQQGNLTYFSRLIDIMKKSDDGVLWGDCCMLFSYAAPFSALHDLVDAYADVLFKSNDVVTQQWLCELLCMSGALWCIPEVLKIFRLNKQRDKYFSVPRCLSALLEEEFTEIADGPPVLPRTDDLPAWFDVPPVFDDDAYERLVMGRYAVLCSQTSDPARVAVSEGALLSMTRVAQKALTRIRIGQDTEEIAVARIQLEAATGEDLSAFYQNGLLRPLSAAACVETLLEEGKLDAFEPGRRYFFGRKIPD